jgi:uncharacterized coiled-coil protein SlyX
MDGDVQMVPAPHANPDDYVLVHWSYLAAGAPWRHTSYWRPPTEPAPAKPTEPDRIAALEQQMADRIANLEERAAETIHALEQRVAELDARVFEQLGLMARLSRSTAEAFQSLTARQ